MSKIVITEKRFQRIPKKLRIVGALFLEGAKSNVDRSLMFGAFAGVGMGTKYKGDLKRGIATGAIVTVAMAAVNGISNVLNNSGKDILEVVVNDKTDFDEVREEVTNRIFEYAEGK